MWKLLATLAIIFLVGCSTPTTNAVSEDDIIKDSNSSTVNYPDDEKNGNSSSSATGFSSSTVDFTDDDNSTSAASIYEAVVESGKYTTRDSVAAYLCKFSGLPSNYVSKSEGQKLYESKTGNTFSKWNFNPWKTIEVMIGGDDFMNYAGQSNYHETLPEGSYHEADVDYGNVQSRGTKRLVYSAPCTIYYTADHYETFKLLDPGDR